MLLERACYTCKEKCGATLTPDCARLLELQRMLRGTMRLFALEQYHVFYNRELETKVVVAWNRDLIIVCVRGTFGKVNLMDDLKVRSCCT